MYLSKIGSSDQRFKSLTFHEGMNVVLAEKTGMSDDRNSRNGAGKSSLVLLLRYLLGGRDLDGRLKRVRELRETSFYADVKLGKDCDAERIVRSVSGEISLGDVSSADLNSLMSEIELGWWLNRIAKYSYGLGRHDDIPALDNLYGQVYRTNFSSTKVGSSEARWKGTTRLGYFMGLSPEVIAQSREVSVIGSQKRAVGKLRGSEALGSALRKAPAISADLVAAKRKRDLLRESVRLYRVDDLYSQHQDKADELTRRAQAINDRILVCQESAGAIRQSIQEEMPTDEASVGEQVRRMYESAGVLLPDLVVRRYEQVKSFHQSVTRNRRLYLEQEADSLAREIEDLRRELAEVDAERAEIMRLLESSVALETYDSMQHDLANLDAEVGILESQLELAKRIDSLDTKQASARASASAGLSRQIEELMEQIGGMVDEFRELCSEVYEDRDATLSVAANQAGNLIITPKITGDNSRGIGGVKTFLLDMVVLRNAMHLGRAPQIIVHDSELFDAMDERQLGSCLNIASRLAGKEGFQYVVLLNSDKFEAAERNGFDGSGLVVGQTLSDCGEEGGLFGFRFA